MDDRFSNLPSLGGPTGSPKQSASTSGFGTGVLNTLGQYKDTSLSPEAPLFTEYPDRPFGLAETEYFRYANRWNFDELGFSPYRDNETIYNAESTFLGEMGRGLHGAMLVGGNTFMDMLGGTADLLQGDWEGFFEPNTGSAQRFSDVMLKYGSRKGGATEFLSNNLINVGFMGGMIVEGILETAVVTLATEGFGTLPELGKIGLNITRGIKAGEAAVEAAKGAKTAAQAASATKGAASAVQGAAATQRGASGLLRGLAANADGLLKLGSNRVVNFLNPISNTTEFFGDVLKAAKAGEELPGFAKGAGAMFRDMQLYKAAIEESKLEAGFTLNEIKQHGIDAFIEQNGRQPNADELARIERIAMERADSTLMLNLPVILLTDKLVLGPMLKMGKTTSRVFGFSGGVADDLARRGVRYNGDGFTRGAKNAGKTVKETFGIRAKKAAKGLLKPGTYLRRGKNILQAGAGEGFQEVFQEVVGGANTAYGIAMVDDPNLAYSTGSFKDFYTALVSDASNTPINGMAGYLGENLADQYSAEGFEVFASGLFIGGIVGGGGARIAKASKLVTKKGRAEYQQAKVEQDQMIDGLVDTLNQNIKDPMALFNPRVKNHVQQKELLKEYQKAIQSNDFKAAKDIMEELRFNQIMTAFQTNTFDIFKEKLVAMRELDEQGISEAVGIEDPKEARERLEETIKYAENLKKRYDKYNSKYVNPFNPTAYRVGSPEYIRNQVNYMAFEEAKRDLIFLEESTLKTRERQQAIKTELGNAMLTKNMSALDVDVLTSVSVLNKEISILEKEVLVSEGSRTAEEKRLLSEKKARLKALTNYRKALDAYEQTVSKYEKDSSPKADAAREKAYDRFQKRFNEYIGVLNEYAEESVIINQEAADSAFEKIVDHTLLEREHASASRHLNILDNPETLTARALREAAAMEDVFVNKRLYIRRSVKAFLKAVESNQVLQELKKMGVAIPHDELQGFLEKGEVPSVLFSLKNGSVLNMNNPVAKKAMEYIKNVAEQQQQTYEKEQAEAEKQSEKERAEKEAKEREEKAKREGMTPEEAAAAEGSNKAKESLSKDDPALTIPQVYNKLISANPDVAILLRRWMEFDEIGQTQAQFLQTQEGARVVSIIKAIVEAHELSESRMPIQDWIGSNESLVSSTINLKIEQFFPEVVDTAEVIAKFGQIKTSTTFDQSVLKSLNSKDGESTEIVWEKDGVFVLKTTVADENGDFVFYSITNNKGVIYPKVQTKELLNESEATDLAQNYLDGRIGSKSLSSYVFDGVVVQNGEVLVDQKGNRYIVQDLQDSVDENGKVQYLNVVRKGAKGPLRLTSMDGLVTEKAYASSKEKTEALSRVTRLDSFIFGKTNIIRGDNMSPETASVVGLAQAEMGVDEFMTHVYFRVVPNSEYVPVADSETKDLQNFKVNPRSENTRIKYNANASTRERASIQVVYVDPLTGQEHMFGYFNDPAQYAFYDASGKKLSGFTPGIASDEELFYGDTGKTYQEYLNASEFYQNLINMASERLVNGQATIPSAELLGLAEFGMAAPGTRMATINQEQKVSFNDIREKLGYSEGEKVVVLDRAFLTDSAAFQEEAFIVVGGEFADAAEAKLYRDAIKSGSKTLQKLGRYVAVRVTADGQPIFIELSPKQMEEAQLTELFNDLKQQMTLSQEAVKGENQINPTEFNENFNNKFYFGYTGVYRGQVQPFFVSIQVTMDGRLLFEVQPKSYNGETITKGTALTIADIPQTFEEMIQLINEAIEENNTKRNAGFPLPKISAKNFYENISKDNLTEEDLSKMKTNLSSEPLAERMLILKTSLVRTPEERKAAEPQAPTTPKTKKVSKLSETPETPSAGKPAGPSDKVSELDNQIAELQAKYDARKASLGNKARRDPQLIEMAAELEKLKQQRDVAYKVGETFTPENQEQLEDFLGWVRAVLPDFIKVETTDVIRDRMISNGITLGRFFTEIKEAAEGISEIEGVIEIRKDSPYKYHEAFHAVFRMLLPDQDIQRLLKLGEQEMMAEYRTKGISLNQALARLRASSAMYEGMSRGELKERLIEEYLADKFEEFKKNPKGTKTSTEIKSVFRKIIDFFINLFRDYPVSNIESVEDFFAALDAGKYKKAAVASNEFTRRAQYDNNTAYAVLEYSSEKVINEDGQSETIKLYLNSSDSQYLLSGITALVDRRRRELAEAGEAYEIEDLIEGALNQFSYLFDPEVRGEYDNPDLARRAKQMLSVINDPISSGHIVDYVKQQISLFDAAATFLEEDMLNMPEEYQEDEYGGSAAQNYAQEKETIGGLKSLPTLVRALIGTTPVAEIDSFGNSHFVTENGEITDQEITVVADASTVYNGLVRLLSDTYGDKDIFTKLNHYRQLSSKAARKSQTVLFIDKLFETLGIEGVDGSVSFENVKNPQLFQAFSKAFDVSRRTYNFTAIDSKTGEVRVFESNRQNEAVSQYQVWQAAFDANYPNLKESDIKTIKSLLTEMSELMEYAAFNADQAKRLAEDFAELTGIEISPIYLEYSYYRNRFEAGKLNLDSVQVSPDIIYMITNSTAPAITKNDFKELSNAFSVSKGKALFLKAFESNETVEAETSEETKEETKQSKYTVGARLLTLARGNVLFNENVETTTFSNARNKNIQTYQSRNVLTKIIQSLRDGATREELARDPYLANSHYLLNDEAFLSIVDQLNTENIDGIANRNFEGDSSLEVNRQDGKVFKQLSEREFHAQNLLSYVAGMDSVNGVTVAPVFVRVLEAASTGMTVKLPVIKAVTYSNTGNGFEFSDSYIQAIQNEVLRDLNRITRVAREVRQGGGSIQNYNNGTLRGLKLGQIGNLFTPEQREKMEKAATNNQVKAGKDMQNAIVEGLNRLFEGYIGALKEESLVYDKGNGLQAIKVIDAHYGAYNGISVAEKKRRFNKKLKQSAQLNFVVATKDDTQAAKSRKLQHNLAQFFFSDLLNTLSLNQLVHGDPAESFKDGVDMVKRAKGYNVSGINASHSITSEEFGITQTFNEKGDLKSLLFEEDEVNSTYNEGKTNRDDGQLYMTAKGLRHVLFGMGRLSKQQAALIDKLEAGQRVTDAEVFGALGSKGSVQFNTQTNSLKLVYFDGKNYLKMSAFLLTKEFTDRQNTGLEGSDNFLHNLRVTLEQAEAETNSVVFGSPTSASKGRKEHVFTRQDVRNNKIALDGLTDLDPNYLYLSTETPSNKIKINNPTQMRHIILSEYLDTDKVYINGEKVEVGKLRREYMENDAHTLSQRYFGKRNSLFNMTKDEVKNEIKASRRYGKITPKLDEFRRYAVETLESIGASPQEIDLFKNPNINLNNPITLKRFENMILSMFNKQVIKDKLPGYKLTLVSDSGVKVIRERGTAEKNGTSVDTVIPYAVWESLPKAKKDSGNYYMDDLKHDVKQYADDGKTIIGSYTEMMMPPHRKGAADRKGAVRESNMFGVRIPSQDKHSAVNLKVVDYLPAHYGSVGVFAKELIEISGADFDIDSLYIHRKEGYYNVDGEYVFHGEQKTKEEKYEAYLLSMYYGNQDVRRSYRDMQELPAKSDDLYEEEDIRAVKLNDIKIALEYLKLPATREQYEAAVKEAGRDINILAIQNRQVDIKTALLGSRKLTEAAEGSIPAAYQAANTDPFDAFEMFLATGNSEFLEHIQGGERMVDSPLGKAKSFYDIHEGAENIGPAVNTAVAYAVLNAMGIRGTGKSGFMLNGKTYNSFTGTEATDGSRIMNNLSAVITAMTDNAKLQLARKYGLNIQAVGMFSYMLSTGVPFNEALALMNQPVVREYFRLDANRGSVIRNEFTDGTKKQELNKSKNVINQLKEQLGVDAPEGESVQLDELTANLSFGLNQGFSDAIGSASDDVKVQQAKVLALFEQVKKQADIMREVASAVKVGAGIGQDLSQFNYKNSQFDKFTDTESVEKLAEAGFPTEGLGNVFTDHPIIATEGAIRKELSGLFRTIFVKETPIVKAISEMLSSSLTASSLIKATYEEKLINDLLSAMLGQAYKHTSANQRRLLKNLGNQMIYQSEQDRIGGDNVVDIVNSLRRYLKENGKSNKFIEELLYALPAVNPDGTETRTKGVNQVKLNSWSKLSPEAYQRIESDMGELMSDNNALDLGEGLTVRGAVMDLVHYLFIKDGLTFKSGSFLSSIPSVALARIFGINDQIIESLKSAESSEEKFALLFGMSIQEFTEDFINNWPLHASNNAGIKMVYPETYKGASDALSAAVDDVFEFTGDGEFLNINLFGNKKKQEGAEFNKENFTALDNAQFAQIKKQDGDTAYEFPLYVKVKKGSTVELYRLRSWTNSVMKQDGTREYQKNDTGKGNLAQILRNLKVTTGSYTPVGTQAQYEKVTIKGERSQSFGGAHVFGPLPDFKAPVKKTKGIGRGSKVETGVSDDAVAQALAKKKGKASSATSSAKKTLTGLSESPVTPETPKIEVGSENKLTAKARSLGYNIVPGKREGYVTLVDLIDGVNVSLPSIVVDQYLDKVSLETRENRIMSEYNRLKSALKKKGYSIEEANEQLSDLDLNTAAGFVDTVIEIFRTKGNSVTLQDVIDRINKCYS